MISSSDISHSVANVKRSVSISSAKVLRMDETRASPARAGAFR